MDLQSPPPSCPDSTSKPWCIWPYFNISVRSDGKLAPCCVWPPEQLDHHPDIQSAIDSPLFQRIRALHAAGITPDECRSCDVKDAIGSQSVRYLGEEIAQELHFDHRNGPQVISHEVNFSNLCNMKCRTCSGANSTRWLMDEKRLGHPQGKHSLRQSGWHLDITTAKHIRRLEFVGGEPTLFQDEICAALELINTHGSISDLMIDITTNGMRCFNQRLLDLLSGTAKTFINVSLDGYGQLNDYVRSDSKWHTVSQTLIMYDRLVSGVGSNIRPQMVSVCSLYNVNRLWELWDWANNHLSYGRQRAGMIMLYDPLYMDSRILKRTHKERLIDRLGETISEMPWRERELRSIMNNLQTDLPNADQLRQEFMLMNDRLDDLRQSRLQDCNPEIYAWLYSD